MPSDAGYNAKGQLRDRLSEEEFNSYVWIEKIGSRKSAQMRPEEGVAFALMPTASSVRKSALEKINLGGPQV